MVIVSIIPRVALFVSISLVPLSFVVVGDVNLLRMCIGWYGGWGKAVGEVRRGQLKSTHRKGIIKRHRGKRVREE